jgi:hypothetical protein
MIRRIGVWITAIAAASLLWFPGSASASGPLTSCDIGVPALVQLFPTSATHVSPGQTIRVGFEYINVEARPSSTFYFRKAGGGVLAVPFDSGSDFTLTIPAGSAFGRYRLVKIETRSLNATSEQLRNFALEGVTDEGVARSGTCPLPFSVLDLVVSAGPSRRGL